MQHIGYHHRVTRAKDPADYTDADPAYRTQRARRAAAASRDPKRAIDRITDPELAADVAEHAARHARDLADKARRRRTAMPPTDDEVREAEATIAALAKMATEDWTDAELTGMNLCAQLGTDPRGRLGHDKAVRAHLIDPDARRFSPEVAAGFAWAIERRAAGRAGLAGHETETGT